MTNDPYTLELRLCDNNGIVSNKLHDPPSLFNPGLTYLGMMNNLVKYTCAIQDNKYETITEPFTCTGYAHLIGHHIRCISLAHLEIDICKTV